MTASGDNPYRHALVAGIEALQLEVKDEQVTQLLAYHQMLAKWNKAYNLTAIRDPLQMISRHLLDSLTIAPYLQGNRFIDVGTGAGLPGVVLAIVFPYRQFDLLDSAGKKTRFLVQVVNELKLDNVGVRQSRAEDFVPDQLYDGVISRAFASLADMVAVSGHLLAPDGLFYCMKGRYPTDEIEQLKKLSSDEKNYMVRDCHTLRVPGDEGERHLLLLSRS